MEIDLEKCTGNKFIDAIKDIVKKGNVTRIKIKADDTLLLDIPINAEVEGGAIDSVYLPALMTICDAAAVISKVQVIQVIIERPDGNIEVVDDICQSK
ncbi:DUF4342 domain-containing protein [Clostridium botulinum]|uniref:DUF4342 domain-containing protein n=1 Tax=Clostridium botulinum (strain Okra / Type B1) TaxID=498213 RepID=B1IFP6_CLOBK|nr:DUF4342 domain-containing protein [Clostridium botulinum]EKX79580.1 hypothetical protein CFSAN001628_011778 [Clostridium botulinum CFSAN001628]ACA43261.1 conserved hypothetical protein [Clostridium botulinum B1 str. Okra]APC81657.1 hypothetical protein NPD2_572 [Clostridium botulinum]APC85382.1 hypothetical protein NPD12_2212 [Clostridium botulinum]APH22837.1 hypothetical protein NPD1_3545 [Clostridium botulinum]